MKRQARPLRRPSPRPSRRPAVFAGCFTIAAGLATIALSGLAAVAEPSSENVAAFGTLVIIGALAALGGLVCVLDLDGKQ